MASVNVSNPKDGNFRFATSKNGTGVFDGWYYLQVQSSHPIERMKSAYAEMLRLDPDRQYHDLERWTKGRWKPCN